MNSHSLQGNWVDLIIIIALTLFASEAWRLGFWMILADFASFFGSLLVSLRLYQITSNLLKSNFSLPRSVSNALGFLLTAIIVEAILSYIFGYLVRVLPKEILKSKINRILAVFPAVGEGIILVSFLLTFVLGLPITPSIKADISDSKIGGLLVSKTSGLEKTINEVFGGVIEESLTYLTIKPGSRVSVPLPSQQVKQKGLTVDERSETEMFRLINEERKEQEISELQWRPEVVAVARSHAKDMWERNYFGHVSPEGEDVGDRLEAAGISYKIAGENLALAPTLQTAHNGLMNSEGHRHNILDPNFKRVGIGVIDNGVNGKMFVQVFTD